MIKQFEKQKEYCEKVVNHGIANNEADSSKYYKRGYVEVSLNLPELVTLAEATVAIDCWRRTHLFEYNHSPLSPADFANEISQLEGNP